MRLPGCTPPCVVYFLAGSLPGIALLHLRLFSLFGMITRLQGSLLHRHALDALVRAKPSIRSWFSQIRDICLQYFLPHPVTLLQDPLSKLAFKSLVTKSVLSFWEAKLRDEASCLQSLIYFNPQFMSLNKPHPLWLTAGSSPYEVIKTRVQATMLSGRYRTELLCSHWSQNKAGSCLLRSCSDQQTQEDLAHILRDCPHLEETRTALKLFTTRYTKKVPDAVAHLVHELCDPAHPLFIQFLVDCSVLPSVILLYQHLGPDVHFHLFHIREAII